VPIGDPKVIIIQDVLGKYMTIFLLVCIASVGTFFAYRYYITKRRR
jgi:hypothetical protein